MLQYKDLLLTCIDALNSFNSDKQSVEEYIKTYLKAQKGLDDDDHTFIVEVFSGCVQYSKLLNVVVDGFFTTDGKTALHADGNLYIILSYMLMFRMDELGLSHFNKFINTQNMFKMHRFLKFFLNEDYLTTWVHDEWCKHYDKLFVDEEIMNPLLRWKGDLDAVAINLEDKINNRIEEKTRKKPPTKPKSFNLTKPKPRSIPLPEKIPTVPKHKPIPDHVFKEPKEVGVLGNKKKENQQRSEELLLRANEDQFLCAYSEKSIKTQSRMQSIKDDEENKLSFNKVYTMTVPQSVTENRPIKLNAATVLREGALFRKKEKEELEKLEKLLGGARDASDFMEWQKNTRQQDEDKKLIEAEQRRVRGKLSREEAILARQNQVKANQEMVSNLRFENAKMMQEYLALRLEEEKQMRTLVEQIIEGHHNAHDAKVKLQQYKRTIVQEVNAESRELMRRALEDAEEEMRRRSQLIKQIRAMESMPVNRQKLLDLTSTSGHALLCEMSMVELHERLALLKENQQKEMDDKKDTILKEKQAKNDSLMETIARISTHRNELSKAAKRRMEEKIRLQKIQEDKLKHDEGLNALQEKLTQRKEERIRRAEETNAKANQVASVRTRGLIREKKQLEKKRWQQLEIGYQRMAEARLRDAQNNFQRKSLGRKLDGVPTLKAV